MSFPGHRFALSLFVGIVVLWLGVMLVVMRHSSLPPDATGTMLVVFDPGMDEDAAFASITSAGARPIRKTAFGFIWVVNGTAGELMSQGALGAYRELPLPAEIAGCVGVVDRALARALPL